ncbi:hypothetical protein FA95DRAFT_1567700 [Auriscalpium vulgare]|uniref:Uncharacterized protein n=1 Tax=Auriscalpium vulgare TaxID=40419 RepID=A0ACB8R3S3_9AGAM|nr:hypothetical protein FA95DRAFT_1567700 [Auriscalpium vulgare]
MTSSPAVVRRSGNLQTCSRQIEVGGGRTVISHSLGRMIGLWIGTAQYTSGQPPASSFDEPANFVYGLAPL